MAWVESHQSLSRHSKTLDVAEMLSVHRHEAIGILMDLWWWALDNVPSNGYMGHISDERICIAACWDGNAKAFTDVLIRAGFIDEREDGRWLHDWYDYAGKLLEKREKDAKRKRAERENPTDVQWMSNGQDTDSPTKVQRMSERTVPNRTVPKKDIPAVDEFDRFWSIYPRKIAKKDASKAWGARIKQKDATPDELIAAAENYAKECAREHREEKYIKHAATFLGPSLFYQDYIRSTDKLEQPVQEKVLSPEEEEERRIRRERMRIANERRAASAGT